MFIPSAVSSNEFLAKLIIEELCRFDIARYFISPGSRSTPLTVAAASDSRVRCSIHVDERGAAFQAVGFARATGKPGVLICTSGTAPSNYYPALLESEADALPMIIFSADRPPRLQHVSANQTTDQVEMYSRHVKSFLNIKPTVNSTDFSEILQSFSELVTNSLKTPRGPVHVNFMFDEPLAPSGKNKIYSKQCSSLVKWMKSSKPLMQKKNRGPAVVDFPEFSNSLPAVIIAGHLKNQKDASAVLKFAEKYKLPILTDLRSQLRFGSESKNIISYYDLLLKSKKLLDINNLQVIHVGGNIVSKQLHQFIEKVDIKRYIVIHDTKYPFNAHRKMTHAYNGDISILIKSLENNLQPFPINHLTLFQNLNSKIENFLNKLELPLSEITVPRLVIEHIRKNSFLFSASSMPVRDFDMFAQKTPLSIPFYANRGLSGIDGTIASFAGVSDGLNKQGVLVTGDLAFYHDINSLSLIRKSKIPLTIVLINNNGGGIFTFLPIARKKEIFEEYFGAGLNIDFKAVVEGFKLEYYNALNTDEFVHVFTKVQQSSKSSVIEIVTNRDDNLKLHKNLYAEISDILNR